MKNEESNISNFKQEILGGNKPESIHLSSFDDELDVNNYFYLMAIKLMTINKFFQSKIKRQYA